MDKWVLNVYFLMSMTKNQPIHSTLMVKDILASERKCDPNFQYHNLPHNIES